MISSLKLCDAYENLTIKIIDWNNPGRDKLNPQDIFYNNWWYFHGKLETILGYDKGIMYKCNSFKEVPIVDSAYFRNGIWHAECETLKLRKEAYLNGEFPVEVDTISKPCVGFFWTTDEHPYEVTTKTGDLWAGTMYYQRGLVCLKDDVKACNYAKECLKQKTSNI